MIWLMGGGDCGTATECEAHQLGGRGHTDRYSSFFQPFQSQLFRRFWMFGSFRAASWARSRICSLTCRMYSLSRAAFSFFFLSNTSCLALHASCNSQTWISGPGIRAPILTCESWLDPRRSTLNFICGYRSYSSFLVANGNANREWDTRTLPPIIFRAFFSDQVGSSLIAWQ